MSKSTVCRLCLADEGTMDLLFSPKTSTINFVQKIYDCTNLKLHDSEELPSGICEICKNELLSWLKFKRQCINSNTILKSEYPNIITTYSTNDNSDKSTQITDDELLIDQQNSKIDTEDENFLEISEDKKTSNNNLMKKDQLFNIADNEEYVQYSEIQFNSDINDIIDHSYTELQTTPKTNVFKINMNKIDDADNKNLNKNLKENNVQIYSLDLKDNDDTIHNYDDPNEVEILFNSADELNIIDNTETDNKKKFQTFEIEKDINNSNSTSIAYSNDNDEQIMEVISISNSKKVIKKIGISGEVIKTFDGKRVSYSYPCLICGQMQTNLKQHMLTHNEELPFKCPYTDCERAFRQKSNLKNHINIHTGEKPYHCTVCEKKFSEPSGLRSHMVMHTGEKSYHCNECGKSFSWSHTLAAHQRIHTQDRRHPCPICTKRFLSAHALKKHVRTHTGEKPYECDTCKKSFTTSGNLNSHKKTHKKSESFHCYICPGRFQHLSTLKKHIKLAHQQEIQNSEILEIENNDDYKVEVLLTDVEKND